MDTKRILTFLQDVAANNNREWFQQHRDEYEACRDDFNQFVEEVINAIAAFDPTIAHLKAKDCVYRFYRDIRFSSDKSPYKRHFGAYISAHGRKGLHGGYYVHLQPGNCLLAVGAYWLPTNILTSMRNEIMGNIDEWRHCVENRKFISYFGHPNSGEWTDDKPTAKGFGISCLKKAPKDFPSDYEFLHYLRMKDYCAWHTVSEDFFDGDSWRRPLVDIFKTAKPMNDFVNAVIDDYE